MKSKVMTVLVNATVGGGRAVGTPRESPTHTGRKAEETVLEEVTSSGALKEEIDPESGEKLTIKGSVETTGEI